MTTAKSGGLRVVVESDNEKNPLFAVVNLSQQKDLDILSMVSYRETRKNGKHISIFRFGGTVPDDFLKDMTLHGFRVAGVGIIDGHSSIPSTEISPE